MPHIEFIARATIIQRAHVLLCQNKEHGYLYLPGGHIEFGETAAEAAARELMEEAGVRIRVRECMCIEEHLFLQKGKRRHEVNVLLRASFSDMRPALAPVPSLEKQIAFVWTPIDQVAEVDLMPRSHRRWLAAPAREPKKCKQQFLTTRFD